MNTSDNTTLPMHITDHDDRQRAICALLGITGPGAVAIREPDARLTVWATAKDSLSDDGARATYRSAGSVTDAEWSEVAMLAWIEDAEEL